MHICTLYQQYIAPSCIVPNDMLINSDNSSSDPLDPSSHAQVKLAAYPSSQRCYWGLKLKLLVQSLQCGYRIRVREMDGSKMARYGFVSLDGRILGE